MSDLILGILTGALLMLILNSWMHDSYKKILIMNAKAKTAEYINGSWYYVIPQEEINEWIAERNGWENGSL